MSAERAAELSYDSGWDWADERGLGDLLSRAAAGDERAFSTFYDATSHLVWRLELRRWRSADLARVAARRRFLAAWNRAAEHRTSGLSPRAWLLSLPITSRTTKEHL